MRLNRYLAAAGVGSRRACDDLIAAGRITVNGATCTNFATSVTPNDHVKFDRKRLRPGQPLHIILNKPAGFVSTRSDPNVRDTVFDLLPAHLPRLFNVGRLDAQTEGLLVMTNDGDLAQLLTHPRNKVEKEYEVTLDRRWDPELGAKLLAGVFLDGKRARIARLQQVAQARLRVVLQQGLNRQIRRMFFAIGYEVERLVRVRVGRLQLGELPRGHWRPLSRAELKSLTPPQSPPALAARSPKS